MTARRKKTIKTAEDVFNHFGADFDPEKSLEENNRWLSRRIYKDTACGAWAKVEERPATVCKYAHYSAEYVKLDGVWTLLAVRRHDEFTGPPVERVAVPNKQLHGYFWPDAEEMQGYLRAKTEDTGRHHYESPVEFLTWAAPTGEQVLEFVCGSIVEGSDAEVTADPVTLPCSPEDLDATIRWVEDEVQAIWNDTHGCEGCEKLAEQEYGKGCWEGQVMQGCPECSGDGVAI